MEHALRIELRAELLPGPIQLEARGCMTEANCQTLVEVLDRAFILKGCPSITVDLNGLDHLDSEGLRAVEEHVAAQGGEPTLPGQIPLASRPVVRIQAPPMPRHCADPATVKAYRGIPVDHRAARTPAASPAAVGTRRHG